jgi:hypothetical protein
MIYLLTLYDILLFTENTKHCSNGKEVDLSCPEGYMIDILWAVYKARDCHRRWKRCGDPNAGEKVRNLCNGENRCQFKCNDELFNETTCSCKRESLTVNYQCIPGKYVYWQLITNVYMSSISYDSYHSVCGSYDYLHTITNNESYKYIPTRWYYWYLHINVIPGKCNLWQLATILL